MSELSADDAGVSYPLVSNKFPHVIAFSVFIAGDAYRVVGSPCPR